MNPYIQANHDQQGDRIPSSWLSRLTPKLPRPQVFCLSSSSLSSPRSGFSLVEVALAMAIVSFGVFSVVATMPGGMEMLRNSVNDTIESRIAQELLAKLEGSDWKDTSNLADYNGKICYFDSQGNELHTSSGTGGVEPPWTVFTARISVGALPPTLPATSTVPSDSLRQVRIFITDKPASSADRFTNPRQHRQVCTLAVKTSR
ncbi:MAG: Verru_Chthon cassette protein B [Verrucomicrobium sp.]